jgi:hypothetical protein
MGNIRLRKLAPDHTPRSARSLAQENPDAAAWPARQPVKKLHNIAGSIHK